jgi:hypothetical protein
MNKIKVFGTVTKKGTLTDVVEAIVSSLRRFGCKNFDEEAYRAYQPTGDFVIVCDLSEVEFDRCQEFVSTEVGHLTKINFTELKYN